MKGSSATKPPSSPRGFVPEARSGRHPRQQWQQRVLIRGGSPPGGGSSSGGGDTPISTRGHSPVKFGSQDRPSSGSRYPGNSGQQLQQTGIAADGIFRRINENTIAAKNPYPGSGAYGHRESIAARRAKLFRQGVDVDEAVPALVGLGRSRFSTDSDAEQWGACRADLTSRSGGGSCGYKNSGGRKRQVTIDEMLGMGSDGDNDISHKRVPDSVNVYHGSNGTGGIPPIAMTNTSTTCYSPNHSATSPDHNMQTAVIAANSSSNRRPSVSNRQARQPSNNKPLAPLPPFSALPNLSRAASCHQAADPQNSLGCQTTITPHVTTAAATPGKYCSDILTDAEELGSQFNNVQQLRLNGCDARTSVSNARNEDSQLQIGRVRSAVARATRPSGYPLSRIASDNEFLTTGDSLRRLNHVGGGDPNPVGSSRRGPHLGQTLLYEDNRWETPPVRTNCPGRVSYAARMAAGGRNQPGEPLLTRTHSDDGDEGATLSETATPPAATSLRRSMSQFQSRPIGSVVLNGGPAVYSFDNKNYGGHDDGRYIDVRDNTPDYGDEGGGHSTSRTAPSSNIGQRLRLLQEQTRRRQYQRPRRENKERRIAVKPPNTIGVDRSGHSRRRTRGSLDWSSSIDERGSLPNHAETQTVSIQRPGKKASGMMPSLPTSVRRGSASWQPTESFQPAASSAPGHVPPTNFLQSFGREFGEESIHGSSGAAQNPTALTGRWRFVEGSRRVEDETNDLDKEVGYNVGSREDLRGREAEGDEYEEEEDYADEDEREMISRPLLRGTTAEGRIRGRQARRHVCRDTRRGGIKCTGDGDDSQLEVPVYTDTSRFPPPQLHHGTNGDLLNDNGLQLQPLQSTGGKATHAGTDVDSQRVYDSRPRSFTLGNDFCQGAQRIRQGSNRRSQQIGSGPCRPAVESISPDCGTSQAPEVFASITHCCQTSSSSTIGQQPTDGEDDEETSSELSSSPSNRDLNVPGDHTRRVPSPAVGSAPRHLSDLTEDSPASPSHNEPNAFLFDGAKAGRANSIPQTLTFASSLEALQRGIPPSARMNIMFDRTFWDDSNRSTNGIDEFWNELRNAYQARYNAEIAHKLLRAGMRQISNALSRCGSGLLEVERALHALVITPPGLDQWPKHIHTGGGTQLPVKFGCHEDVGPSFYALVQLDRAEGGRNDGHVVVPYVSDCYDSLPDRPAFAEAWFYLARSAVLALLSRPADSPCRAVIGSLCCREFVQYGLVGARPDRTAAISHAQTAGKFVFVRPLTKRLYWKHKHDQQQILTFSHSVGAWLRTAFS